MLSVFATTFTSAPTAVVFVISSFTGLWSVGSLNHNLQSLCRTRYILFLIQLDHLGSDHCYEQGQHLHGWFEGLKMFEEMHKVWVDLGVRFWPAVTFRIFGEVWSFALCPAVPVRLHAPASMASQSEDGDISSNFERCSSCYGVFSLVFLQSRDRCPLRWSGRSGWFWFWAPLAICFQFLRPGYWNTDCWNLSCHPKQLSYSLSEFQRRLPLRRRCWSHQTKPRPLELHLHWSWYSSLLMLALGCLFCC